MAITLLNRMPGISNRNSQVDMIGGSPQTSAAMSQMLRLADMRLQHLDLLRVSHRAALRDPRVLSAQKLVSDPNRSNERNLALGNFS